jgi:hypothetical protein
MIPDTHIPVGRTSLVKRGVTSLQVQTEYASRPYPRVTTTVLNSGQVIQKVERKLERVVESLDEQRRIEAAIQQQHSEILALIEKETPVEKLGSVAYELPESTPHSMYDRLISMVGLQCLYRLNVYGAFVSNSASEQFKKTFAPVFKNLQQLVDIFPLIPGEKGVREKGVCEIEDNRLYYVSTGSECYFVVVQPTDEEINYETALKQFLVD